MSSKTLAVVVTAMLLGTGAAAFASQAGGAHGGGSHAGGDSASHTSNQGTLNSNGPNALNREKGLQRAADRKSLKGLKHGKAGLKQKHHNLHKTITQS